MNYPCLFCPSDNFEHRLVLPMRWRASVCALFYWYLLCDPRRCEINRKMWAPRRVSTSGAPHIVTWIKQTWIKHQCTVITCGTHQLITNTTQCCYFSHTLLTLWDLLGFNCYILLADIAEGLHCNVLCQSVLLFWIYNLECLNIDLFITRRNSLECE